MFTDEEFDALVEEAIDSIPQRFLDELDNVVFAVEDEPDPAVYGEGCEDILGNYDGVSLLERGSGYGALDDYPDCITVFKGPHERLSDDPAVVAEEVRKTVVHEVGHYFGMTEEQIEAMGYE